MCCTAFTILIAIICESFAAVMAHVPQEGVVVDLIAWYNKGLTQDEDAGNEEDDTDTASALRAMNERFDRLERILEEHLGPTKMLEEISSVVTTHAPQDSFKTANPLNQALLIDGQPDETFGDKPASEVGGNVSNKTQSDRLQEVIEQRQRRRKRISAEPKNIETFEV